MKKIFKISAIFLMAYVLIYGFLLWRSVRKIDNFCNEINLATTAEELPLLAEKNGVDLRGPREYPKGSSHFKFIGTSVFSVGEYACRIDADGQRIIKKRLGT